MRSLTVVLVLVAAATSAQQAPTPADFDRLPTEPQLLRSSAHTFRVVPLKGLNRPFAMAFLPDGGPAAPGMEAPFLFWVPSIAPSGLEFYTGDAFKAWKGNIFVGGMRGTVLQRIVVNTKGLPTVREPLLTELQQRIRDVRQGPDGLLYVLTDETHGALLRLEPADPASGISTSGRPITGFTAARRPSTASGTVRRARTA